MNIIVGAYETWIGGKSSLYLLSVDGRTNLEFFIDGNEGSFATLHLFHASNEDGIKAAEQAAIDSYESVEE